MEHGRGKEAGKKQQEKEEKLRVAGVRGNDHHQDVEEEEGHESS